MTKLLGVIGDPIAHSLSPIIHNGWLRDMGFDATYEAMHVPKGEFTRALKTLEKRDCLGVNVTLPHKGAALLAANMVSDAAQKIQAANTLTYLGESEWRADNTDAPGFMEALGRVNPDSDRAVILGAGGSARAIVHALSVCGVNLAILNRTVSKAEALAGDLGDENAVGASIDLYTEYIESATIIINTTSMGHEGRVLELPDGRGRTFFDISYGKISAPQLQHAAEKGWQVKDGLTMLVAQAAFSFKIWFGEMPDLDSGLRRCRAALEAVS
nr:shikimate dehydrogenase [Hyphomonas sp. Mor2]